MVKAPRGTKDLLPGEVEKWQYVENVARDLCRTYGYKEIRTPIFEHTELFLRGIGEATDIVQKEMYTFEDRGGRSITLRPEGTASVVRAYLEHRLDALPQPVKIYYIGPMFRYDRPQAGRFRQFHQFGFESFGSNDPAVDAEIICCTWDFFKKLGLTGLQVELNSVGCPKCRPFFRKALYDFYLPVKDILCSFCQERLERNPLRLLDCKTTKCQTLGNGSPNVLEYLCKDCLDHFNDVQSYLGALQVPFQVNSKLVRGLDYYTNTAFEVKLEELGAQSSLAGGGRYNNLVETCGGPPTPGIGVAIGLERVMLALERKEVRVLHGDDGLIFVATAGDNLSEQLNLKSMSLVTFLRRAGYVAERDFMGRSLKAQMKMAGRLGAHYVIIVGEDELRNNIVIVRDMKEGTQIEVEDINLLNFLNELKIKRGEADTWNASKN